MPLSPIAILAGGRGRRLGALARDRPKALVEVAGEPFLFHQIRLLREAGASRVVVCTGYRGSQIREALGSGSSFGLEVEYSDDGAELVGTAEALRNALPKLGEAFHVLYGDAYLRIDYEAVESFWRESRKPALMTVFRNKNELDRSNAIYVDGQVVAYDKDCPTPEMEWIDYGLSVLTPAALEFTGADLAAVFHELAENGLLAGYPAAERFYHVGDPAAIHETDAFLRRLREVGDGT